MAIEGSDFQINTVKAQLEFEDNKKLLNGIMLREEFYNMDMLYHNAESLIYEHDKE